MLVMEELLTVAEVARVLKTSVPHVRELLKRGELKGRKIGRAWRVTQDSLRSYINPEDKK